MYFEQAVLLVQYWPSHDAALQCSLVTMHLHFFIRIQSPGLNHSRFCRFLLPVTISLISLIRLIYVYDYDTLNDHVIIL